MIRCYRGVAKNNLHYPDALQGIVKPIGGSATPKEHNEGDTRSTYTSWTPSLQLAREKAQDQDLGGHGVVVQRDFDAADLTFSPDAFQESEVLVRGLVTDSVVIEVL